MFKRLILILSMLFSSQAYSEVSFSGNIGFMSDYVFRGIHQSSSAAMGGVDIEMGGFYAGIWGADLQNGKGWASGSHQGIEYDIYAGYGMDLTDSLSGYVGYTAYRYSDKGSDAFDDDYDEVNIGISYALTDDLSLAIDYANGENEATNHTKTDYDVGTISLDYLGFYVLVGDWGISEDDAAKSETDAGWWELGYTRTVGDFDLGGSMIMSEKELASGSDSGEDGDFTRIIFTIGYAF
ncbi:MAG: hypothetical protein CMD90_01755 [Gammaproteobacteria bacterium]|nr:hypothetical protein [Gammaproteobacteria bacterium]